MPDLQEDGTNDLYLKDEKDEPEICTMSVLTLIQKNQFQIVYCICQVVFHVLKDI